jgi:Rrf2 family protein
MLPSRATLLSQSAEHALRATLYLGRDGSGLVAAADIATAIGTPPNYTGKILRRLARKGLLRSVRGPHGGFALRVARRALRVSEILRAVDEHVAAPVTCLLGDRPCDASEPCGAHARWSELENQVAALLDQTTIEDLLGAER